MNKIIRVCAEKDTNLETVAITKGIIIIAFNEQKNFAYGVGYKDQGGGSWGDYHIIGALQKDSSWSFSIGNFQPFDGFYDEYAETASKISDNFNPEDAKKYFEDFEEGSMYSLSNRFKTDLYNASILENCSDKEKELFDFDEEGYPNEEGDYHDSKLCLLTDIDGYEKHDGLLWYIKNECKDIEIKESDIEDYIGDISSSIPGNIHFIR